MVSIKIVLRRKKDKNGSYPPVHPLALRITKDRRSSYVYLGYSIKDSEWDKKAQIVKSSHPNSKRLNAFLLKKRTEASDHSLELGEASSRAVKQRVKPKGGVTFFSQADLFLNNLKASGKYNQYTADKPRLKHFREFLDNQDIAFSDVTIALLDRFKIYLKGTHNISERTIINHLVVIRSIFSQAIKENIVDQKHYPFGKGKVKIKFPDSLKVGLSIDEVKQLEDVDLADDYENHCRNLWLFSYYFAGMRVSDLLRLRFSDFHNNRLHYSMGKNNKGGSLKVPEKAERILNYYSQFRENKEDLIFPELKRLENLDDKFITQRTIAFATSRIDKCLQKNVAPKAEITKPLTMHIARHTFGNISGDRIPIQMLQKLYRHSSVTTTIGYQANFIHKDVDDALEAVLRLS